MTTKEEKKKKNLTTTESLIFKKKKVKLCYCAVDFNFVDVVVVIVVP